jgi:hypothetical protein
MFYHTSTKTLLALLQLLQQTEVSRDFGAHGCGSDVRGLNASVTREEVDVPRYLTVAVVT